MWIYPIFLWASAKSTWMEIQKDGDCKANKVENEGSKSGVRRNSIQT